MPDISHPSACTCTHCLKYWEEHDKLFEYSTDEIDLDKAVSEVDNLLDKLAG